MSNHRLPPVVQRSLLLQYLEPIVGAGVAAADDGDGKADDENSKDGAEAAKHLTHPGLRHHVTISYLRQRFLRESHSISAHRGHRDQGPPVGIKHCLECGIFSVLLKDKDEGGKHDGADEEEEEEKAELSDVGSQRVPQGFQPNGVPCQLENPDHPQGLCDSGHFQQSECLSSPA